MTPDTLLGREYEVDGRRFTVVGYCPVKGLRLRSRGEVAIWASFPFWSALVESGLVREVGPRLPAMNLRTYVREVKES